MSYLDTVTLPDPGSDEEIEYTDTFIERMMGPEEYYIENWDPVII